MTGTSTGVASIRFRAGIGGGPVLQEMHPSAAHTFQPDRTGATIVASAAHPVAGDRLGLKVTLGVGCCAEFRSAAATVARRGNRRPSWSGPAESRLDVTVGVASDAMLSWRPEPGVAADGCRHRTEATVDMAASARLLWRDEFLLDRRTDIPPGTWWSRLRVVRSGWPVVCTELAVGPGSSLWESPAVLEGARAVSLLVVVDPGHDRSEWRSARTTDRSATAVALPLAGPGVQVVAWGDDLYDCRTALERMVGQCGMPEWAAGRWPGSRIEQASG